MACAKFSSENIYCSVEILAGLIRKMLWVACVIFHLLLCALLLPTFQRTSINSTPTPTHAPVCVCVPSVQVVNFSWVPLSTVGNRTAQANCELPLLPLNFCITFRTVIFSLCLFYFVWDVHFYFHGIILYFYCASSEQFFIKFRFSTGPEIKCYLFVALGLVAAALRYAPISVPINQIVSIPPTPSSSRRLWPEHETPKAQKKNKRFTHLFMGRPFFLCTLLEVGIPYLCV